MESWRKDEVEKNVCEISRGPRIGNDVHLLCHPFSFSCESSESLWCEKPILRQHRHELTTEFSVSEIEEAINISRLISLAFKESNIYGSSVPFSRHYRLRTSHFFRFHKACLDSTLWNSMLWIYVCHLSDRCLIPLTTENRSWCPSLCSCAHSRRAETLEMKRRREWEWKEAAAIGRTLYSIPERSLI